MTETMTVLVECDQCHGGTVLLVGQDVCWRCNGTKSVLRPLVGRDALVMTWANAHLAMAKGAASRMTTEAWEALLVVEHDAWTALRALDEAAER